MTKDSTIYEEQTEGLSLYDGDDDGYSTDAAAFVSGVCGSFQVLGVKGQFHEKLHFKRTKPSLC